MPKVTRKLSLDIDTKALAKEIARLVVDELGALPISRRSDSLLTTETMIPSISMDESLVVTQIDNSLQGSEKLGSEEIKQDTGLSDSKNKLASLKKGK